MELFIDRDEGFTVLWSLLLSVNNILLSQPVLLKEDVCFFSIILKTVSEHNMKAF